MVESIIIKTAADLLFSALDKLFRRNTLRSNEKESGRLISEAIQELLSFDPNLNTVRSKLAKAENISSSPSEELMSAREMLQKVEKSGVRHKIVGARQKEIGQARRKKSKAKRKKTKTKASRKKVTKKK